MRRSEKEVVEGGLLLLLLAHIITAAQRAKYIRWLFGGTKLISGRWRPLSGKSLPRLYSK